MEEFFDPYALFGLNENNANVAEARRVYHSLALDTHPDKMAGDASQFKVVHAAWKWIENQLRGVPDAGDVVSRFEEHKKEWSEFLENQDSAFPSLVDIIGEFGTTITREIPRNTGATEFSRKFNEAWENSDRSNVWPSFPEGGYGSFTLPQGGTPEGICMESLPTRQLIIYEAPAPLPDRGSSRHPSPEGVEHSPEDFSIPDSNPLGCDYAAALSDPLELIPDIRTERTAEEFLAEHEAITEMWKARGHSSRARKS